MLMLKCYNGKQREDVEYILRHSRKGDEVDPELTDYHIRIKKEMWIAYDNKEPIAFFYITDKNRYIGYNHWICFVGTDKVNAHKKSFVKIGRRVIETWLDDYGSLFCSVLWRYTMGLRMIKAFKFKLKINFGDRGMFVREW